MKYNIILETFEGPFDLLYHLIEKNEVDIYDIPIAKITDQYIEYLETMKVLDLEITSEFLVMAATLLEIKSKMLLPNKNEIEQLEIEDEDPREELVRRLIEYKTFKDAAETLKIKEEIHSKVFFKPQEEIEQYSYKEEQLVLEGIQLIDLVFAFNNVIKKKKLDTNEGINIKEIQRDEITIEECMRKIESEIIIRRKVKFDELFEDNKTKSSIVITFLAVLELVKLKIIKFKQEKSFDDIIITLRER